MSKNVVFVLPRALLPAYSGQSRHCYYQAKNLAELGYIVHLISFVPLGTLPEETPSFFSSARYIRISLFDLFLGCLFGLPSFLFFRRPLAASFLSSPFLINKFEAIVRDFCFKDTVFHFFSIRSQSLWVYCSAHSIPYVVDLIDSYSLNLSRRILKSIDSFSISTLHSIFWFLEFLGARHFEMNLPFNSFTLGYTVVSKYDAKSLRLAKVSSVFPQNYLPFVEVMSIAHDFDSSHLELTPSTCDFDAIFFGSLSYSPNIEAINILIDRVLPLVLNLRPSFRLLIAGSNPSSALVSTLSRLDCVSLIINPVDMVSLIKSSRLSLAPMFSGSGQQNKILESIAQGVPVVSTSLAAKPLELNSSHLFIADNDLEFADAILLALSNYDDSRQKAICAFNAVKVKFSWKTLVRKFLQLYRFEAL